MIPNDLVIDLITWAPMVLGISLVLYLRRQERRPANTPFDMPIRDAEGKPRCRRFKLSFGLLVEEKSVSLDVSILIFHRSRLS